VSSSAQQVGASVNSSGQLTKILVRATVVGKVDSVDVPGPSFKAVGQKIKVVTSGDGKTVFEGVDGLAGIKVDDWVEVQVPGATVGRMDRISGLDKPNKTFVVQGQSVDASAAPFMGGMADNLDNSKLVRVQGTLNAGIVKATRVEFLL